MRQITNITSEPMQRHIVDLLGSEIVIGLRYYPLQEQWLFSVKWKTRFVCGLKMSLGVLHCANTNFPFDFVILDNAQSGVDPFTVDDFSKGRISLFILDPEDMAVFRGVEVEV